LEFNLLVLLNRFFLGSLLEGFIAFYWPFYLALFLILKI
jgi:hypothetical protein